MKERLRAVYLKGQANENYPDVFSKIGDSITASPLFLSRSIGCGNYSLFAHTELQQIIAYFGARTDSAWRGNGFCNLVNSFSRVSLSAVSGWNSYDALREGAGGCAPPYTTPLRCELRTARPSVALIMFGTNDSERIGPERFRGYMNTIVDECIAAGVIPILSTFPPRFDSAARAALVVPFNQVLIDAARANQVPLWNYWLALQNPRMVNFGISGDAVHPNYYPDGEGDFSPAGLRYGYNQRNLTALQAVEKILRVVILDGTPDAPEPDPDQKVILSINPQPASVGGPLQIGISVEAIDQVFNAWGIISGPAGTYSFMLGRPRSLMPGIRILTVNERGIGRAFAATLLSIPSLPRAAAGTHTVTVGLFPAGAIPTGVESAIPGFVQQIQLNVGN
ncbi:MAG: SGNH/GDSL hydrolase family protein [Candidatus Aureabacteria bacterium]|nr:SGNH/GDSL hydrolase family protein [Candidatus Auribacterota bacterium]